MGWWAQKDEYLSTIMFALFCRAKTHHHNAFNKDVILLLRPSSSLIKHHTKRQLHEQGNILNWFEFQKSWYQRTVTEQIRDAFGEKLSADVRYALLFYYIKYKSIKETDIMILLKRKFQRISLVISRGESCMKLDYVYNIPNVNYWAVIHTSTSDYAPLYLYFLTAGFLLCPSSKRK